MNKVVRYFVNLAVLFDQALNTICGGSPDETMSSRLGRYRHEIGDTLLSRIGLAIGRGVSQFLDIFQKNHVTEAIEPGYTHREDVLK